MKENKRQQNMLKTISLKQLYIIVLNSEFWTLNIDPMPTDRAIESLVGRTIWYNTEVCPSLTSTFFWI